jgi:hypothetical protein
MTDIENMSICEILNYLLEHFNLEINNKIEPIYNDICRRMVQKQEEILKPINPYLIDDSALYQ